MAEMKEKREHSRLPFRKLVQVFSVLPSQSGYIYEVQKESQSVKAQNISEGGLLLETEKFPRSTPVLKLHFEIAQDEPLEAYGKVVWNEDGRCGIRFLFVDSKLRKAVVTMAKKAD